MDCSGVYVLPCMYDRHLDGTQYTVSVYLNGYSDGVRLDCGVSVVR